MEAIRKSLNCLGSGAWRLGVISSCFVAAVVVGPANAQVSGARAAPYPAWSEPKINPEMTVDQAKALVVERTRAQTDWKGPTSGPKAPKQALTLASETSPTLPTSIGGTELKRLRRRLAGKS